MTNKIIKRLENLEQKININVPFFICLSQKYNVYYCVHKNKLIAYSKKIEEVKENIKKLYRLKEIFCFIDENPINSDYDEEYFLSKEIKVN